jgi:hypothetical protein
MRTSENATSMHFVKKGEKKSLWIREWRALRATNIFTSMVACYNTYMVAREKGEPK